MIRSWPQSARWGIGFAVALGLHAAGAAALMTHWNDEAADQMASAPVLVLLPAPEAAAPSVTPTEMPPDVVESKLVEPAPEPEPEVEPPKIELPPTPAPKPELTAVPPPPKPAEKKVEKKKAEPRKKSVARATTSADKKADQLAAPMAGAVARNSNAVPNWTSDIKSRLERYKRYPSDAQANGDTGTVNLAFSVDRNGGVHNVRIVGSSGSSALDRETLTLPQRASPFPAPPPEMSGTQIAIAVPIRYSRR